MTGRHRRLFRSAVALALVLVVGGVLLAYVGYRQTAGPAGAVKGYFAALRRGDAAEALGYGVVPDGAHTLLTSTVLRAQRHIATISNVSVVGVRRNADAATVDVRYDAVFAADRLSVTDSVPVTKHGSSWRLDRVAVPTTFDLLQASDRASIVGAAVPRQQVLVFPGAAPIELDTPYLEVEPDSSIVTFTGSRVTTINVVASTAGRAAVHKALASALASCVTARAAPTCPLPDGRSVPGSVRGTIAPNAVDGLPVSVTSDRTGALQLVGNVRVIGRYSVLDFDNVASISRGGFDLAVNALVYPVSPLTVHWQENS